MTPPARPQPADHDPQPDSIRLVTCRHCRAELGELRQFGPITIVKVACRCGQGRDIWFDDHSDVAKPGANP